MAVLFLGCQLYDCESDRLLIGKGLLMVLSAQFVSIVGGMYAPVSGRWVVEEVVGVTAGGRVMNTCSARRRTVRTIRGLETRKCHPRSVSMVDGGGSSMSTIARRANAGARRKLTTKTTANKVLKKLANLLTNMNTLTVPNVKPVITTKPVTTALAKTTINTNTNNVTKTLVNVNVPRRRTRHCRTSIGSKGVLILISPRAGSASFASNCASAGHSILRKSQAACAGTSPLGPKRLSHKAGTFGSGTEGDDDV